MLGLPGIEGTNPASCFPRTVIGHEATCYSRMWSEVRVLFHFFVILLHVLNSFLFFLLFFLSIAV